MKQKQKNDYSKKTVLTEHSITRGLPTQEPNVSDIFSLEQETYKSASHITLIQHNLFTQ